MFSRQFVRITHSFECLLAVFLNFLMLYFIMKKTHPVIGKYSYLLFCFSAFDILYVTIDFLIVPTTTGAGQTFILTTLSPIFQSKALNYGLLLIYCSLFCQAIVLMMFQFVFRYTVACKDSNFNKMSLSKIIIYCSVAYIGFSTAWTLNAHFNLGEVPDEVFGEMAKVFNEKFQKNLSEFPCLGMSFEPSKNPRLWQGYMGTGTLILILFITWMIIIYCGFHIYKFLISNASISSKTKFLQKELFKALLVQLIVPLFCNYIPLTIINFSAMFGVFFDLEPMCILIMIDPILEPLVMIYFIKCYRDAFMNLIFCRGKRLLNRVSSMQRYSVPTNGNTETSKQSSKQFQIDINKI